MSTFHKYKKNYISEYCELKGRVLAYDKIHLKIIFPNSVIQISPENKFIRKLYFFFAIFHLYKNVMHDRTGYWKLGTFVFCK